MLSTYLSAIALIFSLTAAVFAMYARSYSHDCYLYVSEQNKRSKTLKQLTDIQVELTETTDSVVALQTSMKKLRGRMHARTVNDNKLNGETDDEAWKREANAQLLGK